MEKVLQVLNMYAATLRTIYLIHQHCHWTSRGESFYGDHLLFERLYKKAAEDADGAAEKFIGIFGEESMDYSEQSKCISKLLLKYGEYNGERLAELGLKIEQDFLLFSEQLYDLLEKEDKMTLGLDDFLMHTSNSHEEACYLLKQKLAE